MLKLADSSNTEMERTKHEKYNIIYEAKEIGILCLFGIFSLAIYLDKDSDYSKEQCACN